MDDDAACAAMNWRSPAAARSCGEGNIVQALRFAWDDWSSAASSVSTTSSLFESAVPEAFAVTCCLAMVHLMQTGLPHAAVQVAHVVEATTSRVSASVKRRVSPYLLLVSCNATLALASIGGGGGLREWLHPMRASCREVLSQISALGPSESPDPESSIAVACAHAVQGALQALQGSLAKAAASLDDALAYMRAATSAIDVGLLTGSQPKADLADLLRVREAVHDSAVVTWNMCVVFCSGEQSEDDRQQMQQCYDYALAECVKFSSAAGSDPGRPMLQALCGASRARHLHRSIMP